MNMTFLIISFLTSLNFSIFHPAAAAPTARLVSAKAGRLIQSPAVYAIICAASEYSASEASSSIRHALNSAPLSRERSLFASPAVQPFAAADAVASALGEERVLKFDFRA
jgi:predicted nucleic acid-binding protein